MHDEDATAAPQVGEESLRTILAGMVSRRINEAIAARQGSGIEDVWTEDADQYDGLDPRVDGRSSVSQGDSTTKPAGTRSKVVLNITKPKTDAAVARVQEMLLPHDDKPWEIKPTPIPELAEAVEGGDTTQLTLADGTQASAADVAKTVMLKAEQASEAMTEWIDDRLVEGSVYAEMRKVIRDAGRVGTGVLKGPFPVTRELRKWTTADGVTALAVVTKVEPTSKRIRVDDCFPDPACGESIHNGSYFIERDYATARQLKTLAKQRRQDGDYEYDRRAIAEALKEGPQNKGRDLSRFRNQDGETVRESDIYELFYYYGDLDLETLMEMGVPADAIREEDLALSSIPAIVTMLNDRPIKVAINPLDSGEFPFDFLVWDAVDGQPWGRGVPRKMAVAQRMLNASVRALLENAGMSAGPQIGITEGALEPMNNRYEVVGRKLWKFKPNEFITDITKAMQVWTIPSAQQELSNIITFALQMADELTNLPMLLQGQQGSAPELVKGMQMLMANASAPLRVIAKQADDQLFAPHLKRYYDWGMQSAPEECKGDMQVSARGSTALVQREVAKEFLMQLYPLAQDEALRINPAKLGAEMARANGYSLESVQYTDDEWKQIQDAKAANPMPQDSRIAAAQIKAQTDRQRLEHDAEENAQDRAHEKAIKDIEFQIQAMEFAGQKEISFADLRAMLAAKVIDSRDKREEMLLKLSEKNPTNEGI